jgi:serine/threonine protein phosphatase 1
VPLNRFLSLGRKDSGVPTPDRPVFLVGDIHGRADLLQRLLTRIAREREQLGTPSDLVFLGDYVDRGEDSIDVLKRLHALSSKAEERISCLLGNHEQMLLDTLDGDPETARLWLRYGGVQTLASLGIAAPDYGDDADGLDRLRYDALSRLTPELIEWIRQRPRLWRSGDVAAVHAALDPDTAPEAQDPDLMIWGRPDRMKQPRRDGLWVVHGHTITRPAAIDGRRIAIDTGAWFTNTLTAVLLVPGTPPRFLDTS